MKNAIFLSFAYTCGNPQLIAITLASFSWWLTLFYITCVMCIDFFFLIFANSWQYRNKEIANFKAELFLCISSLGLYNRTYSLFQILIFCGIVIIFSTFSSFATVLEVYVRFARNRDKLSRYHYKFEKPCPFTLSLYYE